MSNGPTSRNRAGSIQHALHNLEADPSHHLAGPFLPQTPISSESGTPVSTSPTTRRRPRLPTVDASFYQSQGLWSDFKTLRWMRVPLSSFKMLLIPIVLWANWSFLRLHDTNPFSPLLFISYKLPDSSLDDPRYGKGRLDILFVAYYVIVFSFIRQFLILKVIIPLARRLGINKEAKLDRFGEQGYAVLYYGTMGVWGVFIMRDLPTWWYRTEHFWIDYPHWRMMPLLKRYYLMHLAYWLQQLIIIALKLEKPRKDFKELVVHHLVTIYLIAWSYGINYTVMGNAVFVSMDLPDTLLAISKLCNYLHLEKTKTVTFVIFVATWTYFRHYLNLVMIWSVLAEIHLAPDSSKFLDPSKGLWMPSWMKYQICIPMILLQFLNLFWYFLIWRILIRAITSTTLDDERSDDEDDDEKED